jgi:uridine kinase
MSNRAPAHLESISAAIAERHPRFADRAILVGISGIDAAGKGFCAKRLSRRFTQSGFRVACINIDGWLNPPDVRFARHNPGEHFYENALRLDEAFARLLLPLRDRRSIQLSYEHLGETDREFQVRQAAYTDIDIALVEGIFLFKRSVQRHFDFRIWVDCSTETALERAIARAQEGLSPADTIAAYRSIYFPAQQIHRRRDKPQQAADATWPNDYRLAAASSA